MALISQSSPSVTEIMHWERQSWHQCFMRSTELHNASSISLKFHQRCSYMDCCPLMLTRAVCFNLWPLKHTYRNTHVSLSPCSVRETEGLPYWNWRLPSLRQMTPLALFVFCPWGWRRGERERQLILTLQHRKQSSPGWKQMLREPFGSGIPLLSAFTNIWFHVCKLPSSSVPW